MASHFIDEQGEINDLCNIDPTRFKSPEEVLPPSLQKKLGIRGKQKHPLKVPVMIRLDQDVLDSFRSTGKGWQTRINHALHDWLAEHSN